MEDLSIWWCDIATLVLSSSSIRMETNYWANQIWSFALCVWLKNRELQMLVNIELPFAKIVPFQSHRICLLFSGIFFQMSFYWSSSLMILFKMLFIFWFFYLLNMIYLPLSWYYIVNYYIWLFLFFPSSLLFSFPPFLPFYIYFSLLKLYYMKVETF